MVLSSSGPTLGKQAATEERPRPALRTLIVDDDDALRVLVRLTVEDDARFDVVGEAANGREAVEAARRLNPDVVLLDLKMPVMDGFEALPRILETAPNARVVCLSMLQRREAEPKVKELGALAFIDKGLPATTFMDRLAKAVVPTA